MVSWSGVRVGGAEGGWCRVECANQHALHLNPETTMPSTLNACFNRLGFRASGVGVGIEDQHVPQMKQETVLQGGGG